MVSEARIRRLEFRVAKLEADKAPKPQGRGRATKPDDAAVLETRGLWDEFHRVAKQVYGSGSPRLKKAAFAFRHHLPEREFRRAFSLVDRRGLGSAPRARHNAEIVAATNELKRCLKESHGQTSFSPLSPLKRAV